jgi:RNA polymerase sigma-70 factor, ECF subfamily
MPSGDAGVSPEDLASDTWLTAATKIADFRGSSAEFAGWLFGIARLRARNAGRRTARRRTTPASSESLELNSHDHSPQAGVIAEGEGWVVWLLSHLPPRERQVVACIDVVGLDVATTAASLHMSPTAVRVARHRALRRLRGVDAELS